MSTSPGPQTATPTLRVGSSRVSADLTEIVDEEEDDVGFLGWLLCVQVMFSAEKWTRQNNVRLMAVSVNRLATRILTWAYELSNEKLTTLRRRLVTH